MLHSLNCRGRLISLEKAQIMGILNLTPDSFSDGGRYNTMNKAIDHTRRMIEAGADIIDIGAYSSRPGADDISPESELARLYEITLAIRTTFPDIIISVDTFRSRVAETLLEIGIDIINDISASSLDPDMMPLIAKWQVPYIMMHMQGTPQNMQKNPEYSNVLDEVWSFFVQKIRQARTAGIHDIILDPGFGFGKRLQHNYELLKGIDQFLELDLPLMAGVSRKSMIYRLMDTRPDDIRELTSVLHFKLLESGVKILRVHDVAEAVRVRRLFNYIESVPIGDIYVK